MVVCLSGSQELSVKLVTTCSGLREIAGRGAQLLSCYLVSSLSLLHDQGSIPHCEQTTPGCGSDADLVLYAPAHIQTCSATLPTFAHRTQSRQGCSGCCCSDAKVAVHVFMPQRTSNNVHLRFTSSLSRRPPIVASHPLNGPAFNLTTHQGISLPALSYSFPSHLARRRAGLSGTVTTWARPEV